MTVLVPICSGYCQYGGGGIATYNTLYEQQTHFALIRRKIEQERIASLTPSKMRAELSALGTRIEAARK